MLPSLHAFFCSYINYTSNVFLDLQSEDMDISPLEDESPTDTKVFASATPSTSTPGTSSAMRDYRNDRDRDRDRDRDDRDSYISRKHT